MCEEKVRHVGASDEEHQGYAYSGNEGSGLKTLVEHVFVEGQHRGVVARAGLGVRLSDPSHDPAGIPESLVRADSLLGSGQDSEVVAATAFLTGERQGCPNVTPGNDEPEVGRHDPHQSVGNTVQEDGRPHELRVPAKPPLPEAMADDGHPVIPRRPLVRRETPALDRLHTQHREETRGDAESLQRFRFEVPGKAEGPKPVGGQIHGPALILEVPKSGTVRLVRVQSRSALAIQTLWSWSESG